MAKVGEDLTFTCRALRYVARQRIKTLVIFSIITTMATLFLIANAISSATARATTDINERNGKGFTLSNNMRTNIGTPSGAGTVKARDVDSLARIAGISGHQVRQNATADLVGAKILRVGKNEFDPRKEAQFGNAAHIWGVNQTRQDKNIRSGALALVAGRHLTEDDVHKAVIHEDLAKANGLKLGSKLTLRANPFDADNLKKSSTQVETEIVGLTAGRNIKQATRSAELNGNTIFTDLSTTRQLYQVEPKSEIYQDATFFLAKDANIKKLTKAIGTTKIDWNKYQLTNANDFLAGMSASISGVRSAVKTTITATSVFAFLVLTLVLFLWMLERKKETGVLLAIGKTKASIIGQYFSELALIALPAIGGAYVLANFTAQKFSDSVLASVNKAAMAAQAKAGNFAADMETAMATKTLDALKVTVTAQAFAYTTAMVASILALCVLIAAIPMLRKPVRELLTTIK
ncbi:hypothetical protein HMPREF3152_02495 [Actinomyces sp. HMSC06A08]|nr:hypothetical protein HMPREF2851_10930 [Actinomyces sp. HMSC064C12]OFK04526.1 hypothetical protein HMPREF2835_03760 [Actinomyces sp. HMSC072A03]OFT56189.1 hypothetical protein HMPREF3152_02495 [Actinomyces sp. HMSC06A08]